ncbi:hypothetical protein KC330_g165 [Hortaea werneckii]|nr:hypothetical protein KC330_g165 [Hortaea werneckii]
MADYPSNITGGEQNVTRPSYAEQITNAQIQPNGMSACFSHNAFGQTGSTRALCSELTSQAAATDARRPLSARRPISAVLAATQGPCMACELASRWDHGHVDQHRVTFLDAFFTEHARQDGNFFFFHMSVDAVVRGANLTVWKPRPAGIGVSNARLVAMSCG